MMFSKSGRTIFPLLPPYGAQDPNAQGRIIPPLHPDGYTPYLGLRARLSQVWLNRWTVLLLLVLARLLLAATSLQSDMSRAKSEALSACTSVESVGSAMASMPHYLAEGVNGLTADAVDAAVDGLKSMLMLTLTGVEELVIFFIRVMYQTYLCLFTLAVRGAVEVGVALLEDAADFLNSTVKDIGKDIGKAVETFEDIYDDFIKLVNTAASASGTSVPTLNLTTEINELENIHLSSSLDESLNKLNSSIPNFDQVMNFTENIIRFPFEEVKQLVNSSMGNYSFNASALSVPAKKQLTFCDSNDGINSFFADLTKIVLTARKIFIGVLIVAAILSCIPMAWQEIRRWHTMKERSQLVRKEAHDPMDVVYIVSRPHTAAVGIKAASRFSNSRRQILVRWAIAYATSPAALFVLCLALAGLLSCLCQYLLLSAIQKTVPELSAEVGEYAEEVVQALQNASAEWANDANKVIQHVDDELNTHLFGWVNTSTVALNDTLNTFVDKTIGVLNDTFGGTLLYEPLLDVFNCLIGLKVESVEKSLTWVNEHAHVDFPLLPNDTFSAGAAASLNNSSDSFLSDAGSDTSNKITEVIDRVLNALESGIRAETIIAACILLVWVINALIGGVRAMTLFWSREKIRGEGGPAPLTSRPNPSSGPDQHGFIDVPLVNLPRNSQHTAATASPAMNAHAHDDIDTSRQPAPRYEAATSTSTSTSTGHSTAVLPSEEYPDEKVGFAGQRSALQVDGVSDLRGSSYVEYGMEKS
ncbi:plasma membrane fusion protein Prm1 [Aspergillus heteromorphus CBS 117.55]|uniref:Plasma membrane fusion protein PRM1 n=1 Tax=Aspergillus heteromorphus CBS 117.55 TaxID=1448321 RepID=A0A317WNP7_9EURO|nr:plasma membrane fusion protein Prm1 [Aspergillus heteromorphus CBS 117.55]PWY87615.1 plasma membrane fusion protein Prm1 [Aspergillus heteromorphus CBS 117.55]